MVILKNIREFQGISTEETDRLKASVCSFVCVRDDGLVLSERVVLGLCLETRPRLTSLRQSRVTSHGRTELRTVTMEDQNTGTR